MSENRRDRIGPAILRSVSRSFYLSIQILPKRLREPIALAYLLARSTDTVADTTTIDKKVCAETLDRLSSAIQGKSARDGIVDLVAAFGPHQTNPSERKLIESLPICLESLERSGPDDRNDIREVLDKITRSQTLDLHRFNKTSEVRALDTAADLDQYTYLVAGCVGEFWTRLCFRHLRRFATRSEPEMLLLGKNYGMGLQLINILRDAGADLRAGRCYFPRDELAAAAITPAQILHEPERFQPIFRGWIDKAERGLESGMEYSRAIRNRRVRAATVLPALIGKRTISLLRQAGATALDRTVKIPRREVRRMITSLAITLASRSQIEALFSYRK